MRPHRVRRSGIRRWRNARAMSALSAERPSARSAALRAARSTSVVATPSGRPGATGQGSGAQNSTLIPLAASLRRCVGVTSVVMRPHRVRRSGIRRWRNARAMSALSAERPSARSAALRAARSTSVVATPSGRPGATGQGSGAQNSTLIPLAASLRRCVGVTSVVMRPHRVRRSGIRRWRNARAMSALSAERPSARSAGLRAARSTDIVATPAAR